MMDGSRSSPLNVPTEVEANPPVEATPSVDITPPVEGTPSKQSVVVGNIVKDGKSLKISIVRSSASRRKSAPAKMTYFEMLREAIFCIKDRSGASLPALKKYLLKNHGDKIKESVMLSRIGSVLRKAVKNKRFLKVGARYKLHPNEKKKEKGVVRTAGQKAVQKAKLLKKKQEAMRKKKLRQKKLEDERRRRKRELDRIKLEKKLEKELREKYPMDDMKV